MDLNALLQQAVERNASDLHLASGQRPMLRVHGELLSLEDNTLSAAEARKMLQAICSQQQVNHLERSRSVDFSYATELFGHQRRFRANLFYSGGGLCGCFRLIPNSIPDFAWAGFPIDLAQRLSGYRNGLVLFTGVTGSGKSTSLAMIIDRLNQAGNKRIITVEEPVEYLFSPAVNSMVTQREVGVDVPTFFDGLKDGLRQDPDVILVGEIRDQDTAKMALSAAETGHLVFSTLHTRDAKGAISRYADMFEQTSQSAIRSQLAMALRAVVSQHLLPSQFGDKRVLALEVLLNTAPVSAAIRLGKVESIDNTILTSRAEGMVPLSESLRQLVANGDVTREIAGRFSAS